MDDLSDFWSNLIDKVPANMPSKLPSVKSLVFGTSQIVLGSSQSFFTSNAPSCPNAQLSCHNTTIVEDLCCFNAPGGQMLQTQFWDTNPPTGPSDAWTIHGLWPDRCDGSYEANCDDSRAYNNISAIISSFGADDLLANMTRLWKDYQGNDENLWKHEWSKHGTCVSTLEPECYASEYRPQEEVVDYFRTAVAVYDTRPTYEWLLEAGIAPSTSKTYTRDQIQSVLTAKHGKPVTLGCKSGKLDEVWYHFDVQGSVVNGLFVAADPDGGKSTCPASGIRYPPKASSGSPTGTTTRSTTRGPAPTSGPVTGKGYVNVLAGGSKKGCLISGGTWYTSGTCATFRTTDADGGFSLTTSKGKCAFGDDGSFACSSSVDEAAVFTKDGASISYDGNSTFTADKVASGSTQVTVYADDAHDIDLTLEWQAV